MEDLIKRKLLKAAAVNDGDRKYESVDISEAIAPGAAAPAEKDLAMLKLRAMLKKDIGGMTAEQLSGENDRRKKMAESFREEAKAYRGGDARKMQAEEQKKGR